MSVIEELNHENFVKWIPGFKGKILVSKRYLRSFITSKHVEAILLLLVFLNTLILSLDGLLDPSYDSFIMNSNDAFTILFGIEMLIKLYGFGIKGYCQQKINLFDGMLVMFSIFEFFMQGSQSFSNAIKTVKVFRAIRVLRVTRLLRNLKFMKIITEVIMSSLEQFAYIALLLLLFMIIFSLIGMQIFGGYFQFENPENYPRQRFDTFLDSFLTVFQIMTMENWNDIYQLAISSSQNIIISLIYLLIGIFFGNYIILNLFLAILLEGFTNVSIKQDFIEMNNEDDDLEEIKAQMKKELVEQEEERRKKIEFLENIDQFEHLKEGNSVKRNAIFDNNFENENGSISSMQLGASFKSNDPIIQQSESTTSDEEEKDPV